MNEPTADEKRKAAQRERQRRYREAHPERAREASRRYRETHPDEVREAEHGYRETHRELYREASRRYRQAHPEQIRADDRERRKANPETRRAAARRYAQANPQKRRQAGRRERAALRTRVFDHYGWACACCGSAGQPTIDHIYGGGRDHRMALFGYLPATRNLWRWLVQNDFPAGFQTLCGRCNSSKKDGPTCRIDHTTRETSEAA